MNADVEAKPTPTEATPQEATTDGLDVVPALQALGQELAGLITDRLRLAGLEARRAGESLVFMLVAGIMLAVLLTCVWLGLAGVAVLMMMEHGWTATSASFIAVLCNFLLACLMMGLIRRKSRHLQFPSTLSSLQPEKKKP
jgi:uncharacterized membrane protein YqjE